MCNFINTYYLTFYLNKSLRTETGRAFEKRGLDFLNFFCPCKLDFNEQTHFLHVKEITERTMYISLFLNTSTGISLKTPKYT